MSLPPVLTNRLGPLPVWAWILLGGVAGGITLRLIRKRSAGATTAAGSAAVVDGQTADAGGYTPDAAGYYADTGSTGGSVSGSGGAVGGSDLGTVAPDTGFGTSASPSSPAPPPDGYAYDANGQLQPKDIVQSGMIFGILDDLAAGGYTVSNGQVVPIAVSTPASPTTATTPPDAPYAPLPQSEALAWYAAGAEAMGYPKPDATVPPPPALTPSPAVSAPTTSPTAHITPTSGTLLWKGTQYPALATVAQRWGLPVSAVKVTRSGPATGNQYVVSVI